jgi:hypothetical protein
MAAIAAAKSPKSIDSGNDFPSEERLGVALRVSAARTLGDGLVAAAGRSWSGNARQRSVGARSFLASGGPPAAAGGGTTRRRATTRGVSNHTLFIGS